MSMSRTDFETVAAVIKPYMGDDDSAFRIARDLCIAFRKANPRFKEEVFMRACGDHGGR